jgi:hypothetical protein
MRPSIPTPQNTPPISASRLGCQTPIALSIRIFFEPNGCPTRPTISELSQPLPPRWEGSLWVRRVSALPDAPFCCRGDYALIETTIRPVMPVKSDAHMEPAAWDDEVDQRIGHALRDRLTAIACQIVKNIIDLNQDD